MKEPKKADVFEKKKKKIVNTFYKFQIYTYVVL